MKIITFYVTTFFTCFFIISCNERNQLRENLIVNGSAELPKYDSVPLGWTSISGHWQSVEGDSNKHNYSLAQQGKYHFFEGQDAHGILQQDVNLENYASQIDAHKQQFIFTGYVRSFPQTPADQAQIIITGLDKSKNKTLYTFNTDTISNVDKWQQIKDTFLAPASMRFLRIQLIAQRRNGADNDGYFDNISLIEMPAKNYTILYVIMGLICFLAIITCIYFINKKRKKML